MSRLQIVLRGLVLFGLTTGPAALAGISAPWMHQSFREAPAVARSPQAAKQPPSVSITSPAANTTVSGVVTVQATAASSTGIASVQFQLDGAWLGPEIVNPPYSFAWNTQATPSGLHTLSAVARDKTNKRATSTPVTVNVTGPDMVAPTVSIASPANGSTVSGSVTITASASDNVGVARVAFRVEGTQIGIATAVPYSVVWNAGGATAGTHTVVAAATDAAGNSATSSPVALKVADVAAPAVSVTAPLNGATVSGTAVLCAAATDNAAIAGVQFLLNGAPLGSEVTAAPYNLQWNTAPVANGAYSIAARARDTAGNYATSATVTANVSNTPPPPAAPALVSPPNGSTGVAVSPTLSWNAVTGAVSYQVHFGTAAAPPLVTTTTSTSYAPGSLSAGTKYYWSVAAQNAGGTTASATYSFTTAAPSGGGGSVRSYNSPYCGPSGGSTSWACGAWPSTTPPALGPAGTSTADPDTGNRVLRVSQSGSFGEDAGTAFKAFDGGWKQAWNADNSRFFVVSWSGGVVKHAVNWAGFDPATMSLTGSGAPVPYQFAEMEWDQTNPDLIVGLVNGVAKSFNVTTSAWTTVFDPATTGWGGTPWISGWGGNSVCIAQGPQDTGYRLACYDRQSARPQVIDLRAQTINGNSFTVYFKGNPVVLPTSVGIHTITMAPDGKWLAIDTHGNSMCSIGGLNNYASTALFINLETGTGYEWNTACGGTHWAYGFNSVMMQSASPKWTATGASGPCNSDSRGVARRNTDATVDSSYALTGPCSFFSQATWNVNVHLSWTNNVNDANANQYPVLLATTNEGVPNSFLWSDVAAMETTAPQYQGRLWRFAQTWNSQTSTQCGFLLYSSPSISRDGKWALFPSNWRGQTGSNGVCTNGQRTDLFVFELR